MLTRRHLLAAALALATLPAVAADDPFLIVPGRSVGPITAQATEDSLRQAFGAANVKAHEVYIGEGSSEPGFLVCGAQPDRTLEVMAFDLDGRRAVQVFLRSGGRSVYHTAEGVTLGTTLKELEALNGRPFELAGFSWDYSGVVTSWKGGRLEKAFEGLSVRFDDPDMTQLTPEQADSLMGDSPRSSSLPLLQKLNPVVGSLIVDLR